MADGGGVNHRIGLFDFILIKENHAALAGGVGEAVRRARAARPELGLAVEVRDAAEIDEALEAGAPAAAAGQHDARPGARRGGPGGRAARCSKCPAVSTRRQFWSTRPLVV